MKKRAFVSLSVLFLVSALLFAAGSAENKASTAVSDDGKIHISVYWWGNQVRNDVTQKVINLYMEEHPDVVISAEFADWSGYWDRLSATAVGGNMPDIVQMDYSYLMQYQENGLLADLMPYIEDGTIDTSKIPESIIESGCVDGGCYGIAQGSNALMLLYDPAITEAAGVTIPEQPTLEELYEIGEIIYEKTGVPTYFDGGINMMQMIARMRGSHIFDELAAGDDSSLKEYFEYVDWFNNSPAAIDPHLLPEMNPDVMETKPIVFGAAWNDFPWSNNLIAVQNASGRELAMAMYPTSEDAVTQPMYLKPAGFFSVAETSEHKDVAADFIDFFTNSVEANLILMGERGIPINTEVAAALEGVVDETSAKIYAYIEQVGEIATAIDAPDPTGKGEIEALAKTFTEDVRYKVTTPADAASELAARSASILASNS